MQKIKSDVINVDLCTGCGACRNICPVDAIQMRENAQGFLEPYIDEQICIQCGLCDKTCPVFNQSPAEEQEKDIYAVSANGEINWKSSSGGAFTVLAEYVLNNGGYICGAAFQDNYKKVRHIIISKEEDLHYLRGSKYLQSETGTVYQDIKKLLDMDQWVLFSGCPCQVAGLKQFLKKDYSKLIAVDIICHGVPSPKVYRSYLDEISKGKSISKVDFREKDYWGWGTASSVFYSDNSVYRNDCYKDYYWRAFLGGLSTRGACAECVYANPYNRSGDITIGDFWGIEEIYPELKDKKGVSLLMVNTRKGKEYFKIAYNKFELLKKVDFNKTIELAKRRNGQFVFPKEKHWARKHFFADLQNKGFHKAFMEAIESRYDVGIVGWWYNENYGGTLTYYALHQVIRKMGLSVLMIAKVKWNENYQPNYTSVPYRFAMKYYNISKNYYKKDLGILNKHCKTFISGSDQVFNPTLWEYSGPEYFLDFVDEKNNIISYASSFGNNYDENNVHNTEISYLLHRFNAVSVREDYAVDICRKAFNLEAKKVLDPVFLCGTDDYEALIQQSNMKKEQAYLLNFILDPDSQKREAILRTSDKLGLQYINLLNAIDFESNTNKLGLANTKPDVDIEDWLFYYKNADFVITDSFHGTCFAIIFKKPFISIANRQRGENRFISMLSEAGLMDRLVFDPEDIGRNDRLFTPVDYEMVYKRLNPRIEESLSWLKNAVLNPGRTARNEFKLLDQHISQLEQQLAEMKNVVSYQNEKIENLQRQLENREGR